MKLTPRIRPNWPSPALWLIDRLDVANTVGYFTDMDGQPQILTTLRAKLPRLVALLKEQDDPSCKAAARRVCQAFGFIDPGGIRGRRAA
ncbi:MAG: hypothetical protein OXI38_07855 [Bacteroidota bacterium]|nr:hypothetical protein [Bacteroidota bacterium]